MQRELRRRKFSALSGRQITVDFYRGDVAGSPDQFCRERGETWSNLDNVIAGPRIDRIENAPDVVRVDEKMLAEAAPRNMPAPIELNLRHRGGRSRAM